MPADGPDAGHAAVDADDDLQATSKPVRQAAMNMMACEWSGVQMTTASTSFSSSRRR
jgi:hypothetical protein